MYHELEYIQPDVQKRSFTGAIDNGFNTDKGTISKVPFSIYVILKRLGIGEMPYLLKLTSARKEMTCIRRVQSILQRYNMMHLLSQTPVGIDVIPSIEIDEYLERIEELLYCHNLLDTLDEIQINTILGSRNIEFAVLSTFSPFKDIRINEAISWLYQPRVDGNIIFELDSIKGFSKLTVGCVKPEDLGYSLTDPVEAFYKLILYRYGIDIELPETFNVLHGRKIILPYSVDIIDDFLTSHLELLAILHTNQYVTTVAKEGGVPTSRNVSIAQNGTTGFRDWITLNHIDGENDLKVGILRDIEEFLITFMIFLYPHQPSLWAESIERFVSKYIELYNQYKQENNPIITEKDLSSLGNYRFIQKRFIPS